MVDLSAATDAELFAEVQARQRQARGHTEPPKPWMATNGGGLRVIHRARIIEHRFQRSYVIPMCNARRNLTNALWFDTVEESGLTICRTCATQHHRW